MYTSCVVTNNFIHLNKVTMASECETLEDLYKWCLDKHYKKNDHHPEHFDNPDAEMSENAKIELTCDLLGSIWGVFRKKGISVSISECRFIIENQKWRHWKHAIKKYLPITSNIAPDAGKRWEKFPDIEKEKLKELFESYKNGACLQGIHNELLKLESVQYYLKDLEHHKEAVIEVWKQIPEFNVPGMRYRIQHHDDDKYETMMILGYTAQWCFKD